MHAGDDLPALILDAARSHDVAIEDGDVLVVTQKIVSKAEGRIVDLEDVTPSPFALQYAAAFDKDARQIEVVLGETKRIVRMEHGVMICETHHGFICANAGVDASNVEKNGHRVPAAGRSATHRRAHPRCRAARARVPTSR